MPALGCTYAGALSTGHICYPPTALSVIPTGGPVFVNAPGKGAGGKGGLAGRLGDLFAPHACPCAKCPPPHLIRPISSGAKNVYFNMRPAGRMGDQIACGDIVAEGSFNVFASITQG